MAVIFHVFLNIRNKVVDILNVWDAWGTWFLYYRGSNLKGT